MQKACSCNLRRVALRAAVLISIESRARPISPGCRFAPIVAAEPLDFDHGAAALWQSLLKLHTRASLLMVTAHPDDEDGGMLTYESRGQGARVALLTLNRGEGGANVMSSDYFDALGLVRTEELLAADRYYGVQQFWRECAITVSLRQKKRPSRNGATIKPFPM